MESIETNCAVVRRVSPHVVECWYKPGTKVDASAIRENLEARKQLATDVVQGVIGIFPEDVDFDLSLIFNDHYGDAEMDAWTSAVAIVAQGMMFERLAKVYFNHHPANFPTRVFNDLEEARSWVAQCVQEHSAV